MKRLNRVAIFFVLIIMGLFITAKPAQAGLFDWFREAVGIDKNIDETLKGQVDATKGKVSLHSFVPAASKVVDSDFYLKLNGPPKGSIVYQNMTDEEKKVVYEMYGDGVIGEATQALAMLYTPPASGTTYVAQLLEDAHIIPQAQAQGLGFSSLDPVLETWKVFRNLAYFFFVIVFLLIGFMIMFRQKIGGQTVVTAQQAIPGIIVSLIFVTFSYAIAGFLIDIMYLLMYLMIGLFAPQSGTELISKTFIQIGWDVVTGVNTNGAFSSMNEAVKTFAGTIDTGALGDVIGWIGGLTMGLIVSIAILIGVFKLFFELLKIYITIIIAIVVSPLLLMTGALPGKNNVGYWIKMVFGNLMAFPMVLFALILYEMFTRGDLSQGGFMPPYLIGRGSGSVMMTLVGIGIILIIPDLIKEMKKAMKIEGGIWEELAMSAAKNAFDGEKAAPFVGGAIGAGVGLVKSQTAMDKEASGGARLKAAFVGHKDKSTGELHGGLFTGARKGFQTGQNVQQTSEAIRQGKSPQFIKDQKWLKELRTRTDSGSGDTEHKEPGADVPDNEN